MYLILINKYIFSIAIQVNIIDIDIFLYNIVINPIVINQQSIDNNIIFIGIKT